MLHYHRGIAVAAHRGLGPVAFSRSSPRPRIAAPQRRQQRQGGALRPAVNGRNPDRQIVGRCLRVFHEHIEIALLVEDPRIFQFELRIVARPPPVLFHQLFIGKGRLRILIERLHVGMRGRRIQVVIAFLHVLPVVALGVGQSEQSLLQNRVAAVPQRDGEAQPAFAVADAQQTILAPSINAAARVVVREIFPASPVRRIILANRAPLPRGKIRAPSLPVLLAALVFGEPVEFRRHERPAGAIATTFLMPPALPITKSRKASMG